VNTPNQATVEQILQQAIAHHRASRLIEAERLYRAVLGSHPNHADASHNLGVLAVQAGRPLAALAHFDAALAAYPNRGQCWVNYIDALLRVTAQDAARQPDPPARPQPQQIAAVVELFAAGRYATASELARATLFPRDAVAHFSLGNTFVKMRRYDEAIASFSRALALCPDYAEAHNNLGYVYRELGRQPEAEAACRLSLQFDPACAEAHNNLGVILGKLGQAREAEASYRESLRLKPDYVEAANNLGRILHELGQAGEAEAVFRQALRQKPDFAEAHYNYGLFLLQEGRFLEAWPRYEHRWEGSLPKLPRPAPVLPQWMGQAPQNGERLIVFGEQGFGDRLQFSRLLLDAARHFSGGVSCVVEKPLQGLFRRSFPHIDILDTVPNEPRGWQCPMLSLPLALGVTLESLPGTIPYLVACPVRTARWADRIAALEPCTARKIGVVWKPGSGMPTAAERTVTLRQLAPLLDLPGARFFSLQKESDADKAARVKAGNLIDWAEELADFDDTAALVMNLDLVIAVDTSVAHMAGALGKPVWLFNRKCSEWRWLWGREDSPWYPAMRIFTQQTTGDWDEVVGRMVAALGQSGNHA
jgi:tetratricopeptide (TPR) repeat protein